MSKIVLGGLQTESRNPNSNNIDQVSTTELCRIINNEDAGVAAAVENCIPDIAAAIDTLAERCRKGGRVIYVGAGTSGRLGVLDASEIPPTYSASSEQFVALIAGGDAALRFAQEGAEDDVEAAVEDLKALELNGDLDSLIGIASSGRTPYVLSCLSFAKSIGCATIGIACSSPSAMSKEGNVDHMISVVTGPEVVTGSTRLKAGTATKLVLNMLSTGVMIKLGKTYGNMMIDLKATNEKLQQRSRDIVRTICGSSCPTTDEELDELISKCDGSVKTAVAAVLLGSVEEANKRLSSAAGVLAEALRPSKEIYINGHNMPAKSEEYVLCVDGGGSKCAAVLLGSNGTTGRGEAGPCNVSNVGFETAMSAISLSIQRALDSCPSTRGKEIASIQFKKVWIGLAGYDRPNIARLVDPFISNILKLQIGQELKVSSDIELLVTAFGDEHKLDSVVVLIAGTGSIAMSYLRNGDGFKRTGRAGGWGHLLGDDGSGYSLGRQGLRTALQAADDINLGQKFSECAPNYLVEKVFEHFGIKSPVGAAGIDLLNRVLSSDSDQMSDPAAKTRKIAEVARVVLNAAPSSDEARVIVKAGSESLVHTLSGLIRHGGLDPLKSSLILAGGLLQNDSYQKLVLSNLSAASINFGHIEAINDPASIAARYLLDNIVLAGEGS